jgi:hypothetical protein
MSLSAVVYLAAVATVAWAGQPSQKLKSKGEFMAGTFILTQQSLLEAPYRYAGILRDVLDRVEAKQPPSQSDEANCDVKYRIEPSGWCYKTFLSIKMPSGRCYGTPFYLLP